MFFHYVSLCLSHHIFSLIIIIISPAEQREPGLVVGVVAPGRRPVQLRARLAPDLGQERRVVHEHPLDAVLALGVEEADRVVADGDVDAAVPGLGVLVVAVDCLVVFFFRFEKQERE